MRCISRLKISSSHLYKLCPQINWDATYAKYDSRFFFLISEKDLYSKNYFMQSIIVVSLPMLEKTILTMKVVQISSSYLYKLCPQINWGATSAKLKMFSMDKMSTLPPQVQSLRHKKPSKRELIPLVPPETAKEYRKFNNIREVLQLSGNLSPLWWMFSKIL